MKEKPRKGRRGNPLERIVANQFTESVLKTPSSRVKGASSS
jgi:hypothetical protein